MLKNLRRRWGACFVGLAGGKPRQLLCYNGRHRYHPLLARSLDLLFQEEPAEVLRLDQPGQEELAVRMIPVTGRGLVLAGFTSGLDRTVPETPLPRREYRSLQNILQKIDAGGLSVPEFTLFSDSFFRRAPFGLLVMDFQGRIVEWNEKMNLLCGWKREEVLGHSYAEYLLCDVPLESLLRGLLFSDSLFLRNYRCLNRSQEEFLMNVHLFLWEEDTRAPRVVFVIEDVTEMSRLGENVRQIEKLSTLGRFISGIAHEINNPLAVIYGYAQMLLQNLERGMEGCRQCKSLRRGLERIEDEAEHCGNLIQNLIDFSKPMSLQREPTDLNLLIKESLSLMDIYLLQGNEMEHNFASDLPRVLVDRLKLKQVFINLAKNAFEAMSGKRGKLVLSTRLKTLSSLPGKDLSLVLSAAENRQAGGTHFIQIEFSDNGDGIPQDRIHHIFEPFYTTRDRGTGLGLSICYGIVKTHGGWIEIDSPGENERGTVVTVYLPVEVMKS